MICLVIYCFILFNLSSRNFQCATILIIRKYCFIFFCLGEEVEKKKSLCERDRC